MIKSSSQVRVKTDERAKTEHSMQKAHLRPNLSCASKMGPRFVLPFLHPTMQTGTTWVCLPFQSFRKAFLSELKLWKTRPWCFRVVCSIIRCPKQRFLASSPCAKFPWNFPKVAERIPSFSSLAEQLGNYSTRNQTAWYPFAKKREEANEKVTMIRNERGILIRILVAK